MTKNSLGYQVIEDNAGNLFLAVFDNDNCIWFAHGYEHNPDNLHVDIAALKEGSHPIADRWESNLPDGHNPQQLYDELTSYEYGWAIIADETNIYPHRMGKAGRIAFGLDN